MRKILIGGLCMEIGGAERALLGLLNALDPEHCDIDLFLHQHVGAFMPMIPEYVHLLPEQRSYAVLTAPMAEAMKRGEFAVVAGRLYGKLKAKSFCRRNPSDQPSAVSLEYSHKYTRWAMPDISDTEYDLAVSFCAPHHFFSEKVRAKKKAAWIHTDYQKIQIDVASELEMWSRYDHIISISDAVTQSFLRVFPELEKKILKIENILVPEFIHRDAKCRDVSEEMPLDGSIRLLSIGRFCEAKNFDNIPRICRRIVSSGLYVKWYIIGYGGDEPLIRQKIAEAAMEQNVIILGKKDNPYPYIAACDLYVQPSRYEGKAVTVQEAQLLGKPVVITRYPTSADQLTEGVDGIIVPMDNEGCADGIAALLRDPEKMRELSEACRQGDYSNASQAAKLMKLVE